MLTMVPESWKSRKAAKEFQLSRNLMASAKHLNSKHGVLAILRPQIQTVISSVVKEKIVSFYRSDTLSRVCPGKKDYKSVKTDGVKEHVQKLLLLVNLK